ncbi:hypothetical protein MY11210_005721 [Beauveria gryllotalpidicola]
MTTTATIPRRFKTFKYSKVRPFTTQRQANFTLRANIGNLNRPYDPERDEELRQMREGSMASDFDHLEFRIREERVDLTWQYSHHDIEMPTPAQLGRLAPCVRRTMRVWKQTPREELYNHGPVVAPLPKIPGPLDDSPEWGFRDKYMYRPKQAPGEQKEKKKKQKQKKKRKSRTQSEHPEEEDLEIGHRPKRPRIAEEEVETGEHEEHLPPTPAQTPRCTPDCDRPVPSIEHSPGAIARADAGLAVIAAFNSAQPLLCASPTAPAIPPAAHPCAATAAAATAATAADPGPPQFAKDGFFALPHQVRLQIYRHLLSLELHPKILRTSSAAFDEAAAVLYGENQFLYLLRDGANHVADVAAIGQDDAPQPASDVEEEQSEQGRRPTTTRTTTRRGRKPLQQYDINLSRYIWRMRRICIEAEHNRFADEAQNRATSAVKVFTDHFAWCPNSFRTRLASIELRVVPVWEAGVGGGGGGGFFTFLDWFDADTELMRAVRNLSCDKMTVRLLPPPRRGGRSRRGRGLRRGGSSSKEEEEEPTYAYELGMHDYQVGRLVGEHGFTDPWCADEAMQLGRAARTAAMEDAFAKLRGVLEGVCRDPEYGKRGCPRLAEGSDDDGDDSEDGDGAGEDGQGEEDEEALFDEEIIVEQDDENDGDYED